MTAAPAPAARPAPGDAPGLSPRGDRTLPLRAVFGWFWSRYLRDHRWIIGIAILLMSVEGAMLGLLSYMVQPMFDRIFVGGDRSAVVLVAFGVAGVFAIRAASGFLHRVMMEVVAQRMSAAIRRDLAAHILTLDGDFFATHSPGLLLERVTADSDIAVRVWPTLFAAGGRDLVSLISLLAVAAWNDWVWTLIAIAGAPVLVLPILWLERWVRTASRGVRDNAAGISLRLNEMFHGIATIKLNGIERREADRFGRVLRSLLGGQFRTSTGQAGIPALMDIVAAIGFFGVLTYGGFQIIDGDKTTGQFMSFFTAMALVFEPLRRLGNVSGVWQAAQASIERIWAIFEARPTIVSPARPVPPPAAPRQADVTLTDVSFAYGTEPVLRGLSLTARAGETTALVGPSGAGKSTIFALLTRLVDAQSGAVAVGGVPVRDMRLEDLRGLFSVVTQDAPMFDDTLRDNILLGLGDVGEDRLMAAVEAAHVADFLGQLPDGLDSPAGPRGSNLSGGQRQRVAIARALLRDAPILLLDEATSALDAASEARVQSALERLAEGRTTLVIAHRLATIREAAKIVVMESGRVVETGRHDDLLARDGLYADLYRLQFRDGG